MARMAEHEMRIEVLDTSTKARALFDEIMGFLQDRLRTVEGSRVSTNVVQDNMPEPCSVLGAGLLDEINRIADS